MLECYGSPYVKSYVVSFFGMFKLRFNRALLNESVTVLHQGFLACVHDGVSCQEGYQSLGKVGLPNTLTKCVVKITSDGRTSPKSGSR